LVSLEIFSDRFRAGSARSVATDGQRSLLFMLDRLRQATGAAVQGMKPLPPPSPVEAIEFLEFAKACGEGRRVGGEFISAGPGAALFRRLFRRR